MKKLYSIKDRVTNLWTDPAVMNNDGEAIRAFKSLTEDKSTMIGAHPEDYELYQIGEWNPEQGTIENVRKDIVMSGQKHKEK